MWNSSYSRINKELNKLARFLASMIMIIQRSYSKLILSEMNYKHFMQQRVETWRKLIFKWKKDYQE